MCVLYFLATVLSGKQSFTRSAEAKHQSQAVHRHHCPQLRMTNWVCQVQCMVWEMLVWGLALFWCCVSVPQDLPPGGEGKRATKFTSHLQRHQRDSNKHDGARADQLVLHRVMMPRGAHWGLTWSLANSGWFPKLITGETEHREKPWGLGAKGNQGLWYFVVGFLWNQKKAACIFLNLTGNTQFSLCPDRGVWWALWSWGSLWFVLPELMTVKGLE